jgi:hypothetical protein
MLRPTVSRPVSPEAPYGEQGDFFFLLSDSYGLVALSDVRTALSFTISAGLASVVILRFEYRGTLPCFATSRKVSGSILDQAILFLYSPSPSSHTTVLVFTQPQHKRVPGILSAQQGTHCA